MLLTEIFSLLLFVVVRLYYKGKSSCEQPRICLVFDDL